MIITNHYQGPWLGLLFYCSLSLCWCPWPALPPKATLMAKVWASTCGLLGVQWLCCFQDHTDLSAMSFDPGLGCCMGLSCDQGLVWVHGPTTDRTSSTDIRGSCCHQRSCGCLRPRTNLGPWVGWGPCCHCVYDDINDPHCQLGPWWHSGQGCCQGPCLGPWSKHNWSL